VVGLTRWCFHHRWAVVVTWFAALICFAALNQVVGSTYATNFNLPATDSSRAQDILKANYQSQAGDSIQLVVQDRTGRLTDPPTQRRVKAMLDRVGELPHVVEVGVPQLSPSATISLTAVNTDQPAQNLKNAAVNAIIHTAQSADSPALNVQLGGSSIENTEQTHQSHSEVIGVIFALVILFFAFRRSLLCALLPLISALVAIGVGVSIVGLLSHTFALPTFGPILATFVGLGVGVDYALFIVTRHRNGLRAGRTPEDAALSALNTAGRAVFFAGITVCIALLGMFALQVSFLYGLAVSAALVVALTMVASLTLLPAMLGFYGLKALARGERREFERSGPCPEVATGFWARWSVFIQRRSPLLAVAALAVVAVIALPVFSLRLGLSDAGNDPSSTTSRQAYDLLARGFGPGFNGPFTLVAETPTRGDGAAFTRFVTTLRDQPGVASVGTPQPSPNGRASVAVLFPTTSPQARATMQLLQRVRGQIPKAESGSTLVVHVGGLTAGEVDFAHILSEKIPQFVGIVVLLAFLLLAIVFRSLLVPLVASIMNLLSIGAALGVMTAAFQFGWGKSLLGLSKAGPIDVFVPVILFAVLFGLSMDYEVFLVSRMHEEWSRSGDNQKAVTTGHAETGRVITAAALIMILVFASFIFGGQRVIQETGLGFASAIFIDAFVIRTVLVPGLMHVLGRANWWLPGWLDRCLPHLHVDAGDAAPATTAGRPG
jgi:RND superfamily putative drug exporter